MKASLFISLARARTPSSCSGVGTGGGVKSADDASIASSDTGAPALRKARIRSIIAKLATLARARAPRCQNGRDISADRAASPPSLAR
jgi:hypothetical protein